MFNSRLLVTTTIWTFGLCLSGLAGTNADRSVEVHLSLSKQVCDRAVSGRVYVLFDKNIYGHPLDGPDGSERKPFFAMDARNWKAGQSFILSNDASGFPCSLHQIPRGMYAVQAVLDTSVAGRDFADAPGNIAGRIFSDVVVVPVLDSGPSTITLVLDRKAGSREFAETRYIKEIKVESELLMAFANRHSTINAAVILPPSYYSDTTRSYPTVYCFPAFGKRHYCAVSDNFYLMRFGMNMVGLEKVFVLLDQATPLGCHVFANSENNGPWASAFVDELVPYVEKHFRVYADPQSGFSDGPVFRGMGESLVTGQLSEPIRGRLGCLAGSGRFQQLPRCKHLR